MFTFNPDGTDRFVIHSDGLLWFGSPPVRNGPRQPLAVPLLNTKELKLGEDVLLPLLAPWPVKEPLGEGRIAAWGYDKTMDVVGVVVSHTQKDLMIKIYRNSTLQLVKEINVRELAKPRLGCELIFDHNLIVILEKGPLHPSRFIAFKIISTLRTPDGFMLIVID